MIEDSTLGLPEQPAASNVEGLHEDVPLPGVENAPSLFNSTLPSPSVVKILFVTDSSSINAGLLPLANALVASSKPHVLFEVTRKTLTNGTFSPGSLDEFDELWLFGFEEEGKPTAIRLTPGAIEVIARFMDSGGGVLATGDHETRGGPLCGELPRVRNMRKWLAKDNPPPRDSALRHDSLIKPPESESYLASAQSDAIPQVIFPALYTSRDKKTLKSYPHPLLSAPDHVINVLPDHMHEGQCCVPDNLDDPFPLQNFVEYPESEPGKRKRSPEIVARSILPEAHLTFDDVDPPPSGIPATLPFTQVNSFNLIGAYDGHAVVNGEGKKLGRVVVDSSFHHFIEENLKGFIESETEKGKEARKDILQYFFNIAVWLAPPERQKQMRDHVLLLARNSDLIGEELRAISARLPGGRLEDLPFEAVVNLGELAQSHIASLSSISMTLEWSLNLIRELPDEQLPPSLDPSTRDQLLLSANPWLQDPLPSGLDIDPIVKSVIGGAVFSINERLKSIDEIAADEAVLTEARNIGVAAGTEAYINKTRNDNETIAELDDVFKGIFSHKD